MLKIYGSKLCPDCVECLDAFEKHGISYEYYDFADDLGNLKAFLKLRDRDPSFESAKNAGSIGIPCIIDKCGRIILDWTVYVSQGKA